MDYLTTRGLVLRTTEYKETDRMGTLGFYVAPDGRTFSVNDLNEWCWLFRLHRLKGATLEELGLHA